MYTNIQDMFEAYYFDRLTKADRKWVTDKLDTDPQFRQAYATYHQLQDIILISQTEDSEDSTYDAAPDSLLFEYLLGDSSPENKKRVQARLADDPDLAQRLANLASIQEVATHTPPQEEATLRELFDRVKPKVDLGPLISKAEKPKPRLHFNYRRLLVAASLVLFAAATWLWLFASPLTPPDPELVLQAQPFELERRKASQPDAVVRGNSAGDLGNGYHPAWTETVIAYDNHDFAGALVALERYYEQAPDDPQRKVRLALGLILQQPLKPKHVTRALSLLSVETAQDIGKNQELFNEFEWVKALTYLCQRQTKAQGLAALCAIDKDRSDYYEAAQGYLATHYPTYHCDETH